MEKTKFHSLNDLTPDVTGLVESAKAILRRGLFIFVCGLSSERQKKKKINKKKKKMKRNNCV